MTYLMRPFLSWLALLVLFLLHFSSIRCSEQDGRHVSTLDISASEKPEVFDGPQSIGKDIESFLGASSEEQLPGNTQNMTLVNLEERETRVLLQQVKNETLHGVEEPVTSEISPVWFYLRSNVEKNTTSPLANGTASYLLMERLVDPQKLENGSQEKRNFRGLRLMRGLTEKEHMNNTFSPKTKTAENHGFVGDVTLVKLNDGRPSSMKKKEEGKPTQGSTFHEGLSRENASTVLSGEKSDECYVEEEVFHGNDSKPRKTKGEKFVVFQNHSSGPGGEEEVKKEKEMMMEKRKVYKRALMTPQLNRTGLGRQPVRGPRNYSQRVRANTTGSLINMTRNRSSLGPRGSSVSSNERRLSDTKNVESSIVLRPPLLQWNPLSLLATLIPSEEETAKWGIAMTNLEEEKTKAKARFFENLSIGQLALINEILPAEAILDRLGIDGPTMPRLVSFLRAFSPGHLTVLERLIPPDFVNAMAEKTRDVVGPVAELKGKIASSKLKILGIEEVAGAPVVPLITIPSNFTAEDLGQLLHLDDDTSLVVHKLLNKLIGGDLSVSEAFSNILLDERLRQNVGEQLIQLQIPSLEDPHAKIRLEILKLYLTRFYMNNEKNSQKEIAQLIEEVA